MLLKKLLPGEERLELDTLELCSDKLILMVHATAPEAQCPVCRGLSRRIHGVYLRKPLDLT